MRCFSRLVVGFRKPTFRAVAIVAVAPLLIMASEALTRTMLPQAQVPLPTTNVAAETDRAIRWFNGRPVRPARTLQMRVTAYSPDARSCGAFADGITASGYSVWTNGMRLAAADTDLLPFGSLISVPGYDSGEVIPVLDRGGAIKGERIDLLHPSHEQAMQWGVRTLEVTIWEYADGMPNDFRARFNADSAVKG